MRAGAIGLSAQRATEGLISHAARMRGMLYTKTVTFDLGCDRRRQVGQPDRAGAWVNRRGIFSVVSARLRLGLVGLMVLFTTGASAGASVLAGSEWRPKQIGD